MKISRLFWIGLIFVMSIVVFILGLIYLQEISIKKLLEQGLDAFWAGRTLDQPGGGAGQGRFWPLQSSCP